MFLGKYRTTFSGNKRVILPKKFRQSLKENEILLMLGLDGGIWGFAKVDFENLGKEILKLPLQEMTGRMLRRRFFGSAEQMDLDKQGRFIIPLKFVTNALLDKEILIIGAGDHFEIWDPEQYEKFMTSDTVGKT